MHWPLTAQLYLPESWATDGPRRTKVHVPAEVSFHTKLDLALTLVGQARTWAVPFACVVTDAGYGDNPTFLRGRDARQVAYVGGGSPKSRGQPRWLTYAGTVLCKQFVAVPVHWGTGGAQFSTTYHRVGTGPEGWLLGERPVPGEPGDVKWHYSNLPVDTPLHRLVKLAHSRWPIEQFYEDAKGECGLDDSQGRRWDGLHRHLALVGNAPRSRWSIARCACGASKMLCYGSWQPTRLRTSTPGGSNEVVLGGQSQAVELTPGKVECHTPQQAYSRADDEPIDAELAARQRIRREDPCLYAEHTHFRRDGPSR